MGLAASFPVDKKIVVVGGGYAGAYLAVDLMSENANFTLIDEKSYFYHSIAAPRAVVDNSYVDKLFIPYEKTFGENFKQGRVARIDAREKKVILASDEEVSYDVLVLATGSLNHPPYKCDPDASDPEQHARQLCTALAQKVKDASTIVVVGGGPIGVELAAEIASMYKKDITLIHSSEELVLKGSHPNFQTTLKQKLQKLDVKLVLGTTVTNLDEVKEKAGPCIVRTKYGTSYPADLVMCCTGNTKTDLSYAWGLGADCFDEKGLLKVNEYFQIEGHTHVFAIGDCCNADVMKTAAYIKKQIPALVKNIKAFLGNWSMTKYVPDAGPYFLIGVSLGPNDGSGTTKGWNIPGFVIKRVKSKDMMVGEFWSKLKQTPPE